MCLCVCVFVCVYFFKPVWKKCHSNFTVVKIFFSSQINQIVLELFFAGLTGWLIKKKVRSVQGHVVRRSPVSPRHWWVSAGVLSSSVQDNKTNKLFFLRLTWKESFESDLLKAVITCVCLCFLDEFKSNPTYLLGFDILVKSE